MKHIEKKPDALLGPLQPHGEALALVSEPRSFEAIRAMAIPAADQRVIDTSLTLAWLAAAWRVSGRQEYHDLLLEWLPALGAHSPIEIPGLAKNNCDLLAGHLLLSFSLLIELLDEGADRRLVDAVAHALRVQAEQTHGDLTDRHKFPTYAYEQNHLIIPVCGLGMAGMTLQGHGTAPDAWESFARAFLSKSFAAVSQDGWFFEGISYWCFTIQFPLCYARMLKRIAGVDLYQQPLFRDAPLYLAHSVLPDRRFVFDFADWGPRTNPDGVSFQRGYDLPWHTLPTHVPRAWVQILRREQRPGAPWPTILDQLPAAPRPTALDAAMQLVMALEDESARGPRAPAPDVPTAHYFRDMDVLHWRSSWDDPAATALAFKSGPPAGHHLASLLAEQPRWRVSLGHAHPDAGSFLLFAHGRFLANDTGYIGKKDTAFHNSLLVDGIGQHKGGTAWGTFAAKPYAEYDRIHLDHVWFDERVAAAEAVFEDAYDCALKLRDVRRKLILIDGRFLLVADTLRSDLSHEYEWRLHADQEPRCVAPDRFVVENGPARLVIQTIDPIAGYAIAPTVVETELFDPELSRPQQRGFHLALRSRRLADTGFLVAMGIQPSTADAASFQARRISSDTVVLSDSKGKCRITLQPDGSTGACFSYELSETHANKRRSSV